VYSTTEQTRGERNTSTPTTKAIYHGNAGLKRTVGALCLTTDQIAVCAVAWKARLDAQCHPETWSVEQLRLDSQGRPEVDR
jgi:hypothetical protein